MKQNLLDSTPFHTFIHLSFHGAFQILHLILKVAHLLTCLLLILVFSTHCLTAINETNGDGCSPWMMVAARAVILSHCRL